MSDTEKNNARVVKLPVRVKQKQQVPVTAKKVTFTRTDLPEGDFLMNYYFRRDARGELVPEDIHNATHFERVVYDCDGNVIGSMTGKMSDKIKW